jgi:hypothetical protein
LVVSVKPKKRISSRKNHRSPHVTSRDFIFRVDWSILDTEIQKPFESDVRNFGKIEIDYHVEII